MVAFAVLICLCVVIGAVLGTIGFFIALDNRDKLLDLNSIVGLSRPEPQPQQCKPPIERTAHAAAVTQTQGITPPREVKIEQQPPRRLTPAASQQKPVQTPAREPAFRPEPAGIKEPVSIEQIIGSRWALIAGIVAIIFSAGFFLKYAWDIGLMGPAAKVISVAVCGLIALALGEFTRRKGFGTVAKSVTALGFALLYGSVFAAYGYYTLINMPAAFVLAVLLTAAGMAYAVAMDEVLAALLALLGGFLTPLIIRSDSVSAAPLFGYVLVLGCGAMLCAFWRQWRSVNITAFLGSYAIYFIWMVHVWDELVIDYTMQFPPRLITAVAWLLVLMAVYMVLPLLNNLLRRQKGHMEDVLCVAANSWLGFVFLFSLLNGSFQTVLALCTAALAVAHIAMAALVRYRCEDDRNTPFVILATGLALLTLAMPMYFRFYVLAAVWACQGGILTFAADKWNSSITRLAGGAALLLAVGRLVISLPMHSCDFTLVMNPVFGTWILVGALILAVHMVYRMETKLKKEIHDAVSQFSYMSGLAVIAAAMLIEWYQWLDFACSLPPAHLFVGVLVIVAAIAWALAVRPLRPEGAECKWAVMLVLISTSVFAATYFPATCKGGFGLFMHLPFLAAAAYSVSMMLTGVVIKAQQLEYEKDSSTVRAVCSAAGLILLWIILNQEIYLFWKSLPGGADNWRLKAQLSLSIMWAVYALALMVAGVWKNIPPLRYAALGLFGLLLAKVFIVDMNTVKSVYRVAAFMATGVVLVGISYLYQHLRNKGFFEAIANREEL
jgi:uncharacterized membrane protein